MAQDTDVLCRSTVVFKLKFDHVLQSYEKTERSLGNRREKKVPSNGSRLCLISLSQRKSRLKIFLSNIAGENIAL